MRLPTIMLMPSANQSYTVNANTYTSDGRGFVFDALVADIPGLTGTFGAVTIAPRNNTSASSNPSSANDYTQLYGPGSLWENVSGQTLWMCTAMGSTPGTASWTAIAASAGTLVGNASAVTVIPTGGSASRTLADLFADQYNNVKTFGAVGNNIANDTTAIQNAWTAALSNGAPLYLPPGTYKVTGLDFDVTSSATQIPQIIGAGMKRVTIDAGTSSAPTLYYHSTAGNDGFFGGIKDITFQGNWAGPVLKFCRDDFADAINACGFANVNVKNSSSSSSGIAVKINYLLNSVFSNLIANTGGIGTGIALSLNQSAFNVFSGCSFSSSQTGVRITNGFNFSNRFDAPDIEVVNHCVLQDSTNGNGFNSFIGGQFVWPAATQYAIVSSASPGGRLVLSNVNFAPTTGSGDPFVGKVVDPSNNYHVQLLGNYGDGTTPASGTPSTGTAYANSSGVAQSVSTYSGGTFTVEVTPATGSPFSTTINVTAGNTGSLTLMIRPGYSIKITAAAATVNWLWLPVPV